MSIIITANKNIEVHSIVGRFLEHSRVYCFGTGDSMKMYISSADFMTRNMEKRVEVACPVYDQKIKETILNMLDIMLKDNEKGRLIDSNGKYIKIKKQCLESINSQEYFIEEAYKKAIKQVTIDEKNKDKIIEKKELQSIYKEKEELLKIKEEIQYSTRLLKEEIDRLKEVQNEVMKLHNLEAAATSTDK
ncbi:MAG: hypothetical protein GX275_07290 [Clostridiales bacterium]|nr:hypothetical protein [Clostridiales bacterium]